NHGFRVGGSQPEDPVINLLSKGLQVGFLAIPDKDFFARRAIQVGVDRCIQQHRGAAAAALVLTQGVAGDVVHRVVARLHADGLQVTAHEFGGRTGGTGGAVNIGQVEQQFLQTLWIETSTSLLVPLTLFGTERNLSSWFHARLLNYWQQTARRRCFPVSPPVRSGGRWRHRSSVAGRTDRQRYPGWSRRLHATR